MEENRYLAHFEVLVILAAEARKVAEMKARGLNPDGSPYIHLPGMNEAPPTAMKVSSQALCHRL